MRRVLIGVGLMLLLVVATAIVAAPRVLPDLLADRLGAMGFADARIESAEIGLTHVALIGVELGEGQSIGRVETGFRLTDLVRGRLASLVVEDLRIRARLDDDGLTIPGLKSTASGPGGAPPVLPERAVFHNARITVETRYGTTEAELDAILVREGDEVDVDLEAGRLVGDLMGGAYTAEVDGRGRIRPFVEDPLRSIVADLTVHAAGDGFVLGDLAHLGESEASVTVSVADGLLSGRDLRLDARIVRVAHADLLAEVGAALPIEISLGTGPDAAGIDMDFDLAAPAFEVDLPLEAQAGALELAVDLRGAVGLGPAGAIDRIALDRLQLVADGFRVTGLGAIAALELALQGEGSLETAAAEGRLQTRIEGAADGPFTGDASFALPFAMTLTPEVATLAWAEGAQVDLAGVALPGLIRMLKGRVALGGADDPVVTLERSGGAWTVALPASASGLRIEPLPSTGVPALEVPGARLVLALQGRSGEVGHGTIRVEDGEVVPAGLGVRLSGIAATVPFTSSGLAPGDAVEIKVGSARDLTKPRRFAAVSAVATVIPAADLLTFRGRLRSADREAVNLRFAGDHRPDDGRGRTELVMEPLRFVLGGLQPRDLSPAFGSAIEQVAGTVGLAGEVTWTGGRGIGSDLEVLIEDLALTAGPARLEGMAGVVVVDGLAPPSTRPDQRLAIGLMEVGLAFTNGTVLFELLPGGPIDVQRLRFDWAGGRIESDPFTVGSRANEISMVLRARGLDLDAIFRQVKLPGLRGEGTIDGTLPLRIEGAEAVIDGGELEARGPGWLRYRPDGTPGAFAAGGESMALLMQALENFRYEDLRITLDGRTDAAMDIGLHLGGANPDLYDGHPVEFNLNLEGELANILKQGLRSYTLPDRVRERIERYKGR